MAEINTARRGDVEVALVELGDKFVSEPFLLADGGEVVFVGKDLRTEKMPALNPMLPERVAQTEVLIEPDSFVDYILQFKTTTAICKASLSQNQIEAVLDYHGRAREGSDGAVPQRLAHRVTLRCPFDIDYAKWRNVFGQALTQVALAEFIEDMIHTIGSPPAADLTEAINDLKIDRAIRFKSARNERNGNVQFAYEEIDGEGGSGSVSLPSEVEIILPIFQGGPTVSLKAKLRYRLAGGKVVFILAVPGLDKIERDHFRSIGERVRRDTDTPVFYTA